MFFDIGAYLEALLQNTIVQRPGTFSATLGFCQSVCGQIPLCESPGLLLEGHKKDVLRFWGLFGSPVAKYIVRLGPSWAVIKRSGWPT